MHLALRSVHRLQRHRNRRETPSSSSVTSRAAPSPARPAGCRRAAPSSRSACRRPRALRAASG
jgi:hypothetical protein